MKGFRVLDAWRCLDLRGGGLVGNGYHDFLMDEIEVGPRAAMALQNWDQAFWVLQPPPFGNFVQRACDDPEFHPAQCKCLPETVRKTR